MNSNFEYIEKINDFIKEVNNDCFNNIRIIINIVSEDNKNKYKIDNITVKPTSNKCELLNDLKDKIDKLNKKIHSSNYAWNIFYLYKEVIQFLKEKGFNYFRGQTDDWKLVPSVLRHELYKDDVSKNFELKYKKISEKFEDIKYYSLEQLRDSELDMINFFEKRNTELGILQHYGFPTPLLDITKNPYIALLFMCSDSHNNSGSKRFDAFNIDEEEHSKFNIFSLSYIDKRNKRINVQRGEFLDFSKFKNLNGDKIKKINHISIVIHYNDISDFDKYLSDYLELVLDPRFSNDNEEKIKERILKIEEKYKFGIFNKKKVISLIKNNNKDKLDFINSLYLSIKNYTPSDIYKYVNEDLKNKLKEFEYHESDLYPDMEKQLEYMERKCRKDN